MNTNTIVICKDTYNSQEEFENAIRDAVMVLLNNNYIMTIKYDEKGLGIVCIEFNAADQKLGGLYPYWLSLDEWYSIEWQNKEN